MQIEQKIERFLTSATYAVVGASSQRQKYGNKVLRCYQQNKLPVIPVNPNSNEIEGEACVSSVSELPAEVKSISIITPPEVTETVVKLAIDKGIENVWMQPGAESPAAVKLAEDAGIEVIADGSCLLVVMRYHED